MPQWSLCTSVEKWISLGKAHPTITSTLPHLTARTGPANTRHFIVIRHRLLISRLKKQYFAFHKKRNKVLIDQPDRWRINNLNPHHSKCGIITAEIWSSSQKSNTAQANWRQIHYFSHGVHEGKKKAFQAPFERTNSASRAQELPKITGSHH